VNFTSLAEDKTSYILLTGAARPSGRLQVGCQRRKHAR